MGNYHIIINGTARSGKDTFIDACGESNIDFNVYKTSSVDRVYEAARLLGWDNVKDEIGRKFLSDLKDLSTKAYEGPMKYMEEQIKGFKSPYVAFFMIREPIEIQKFCDRFPNTYTILIQRPNIKQFKNHADLEVENFPYDRIIFNEGSLEDLRYRSSDFMKNIKSCLRGYDVKIK